MRLLQRCHRRIVRLRSRLRSVELLGGNYPCFSEALIADKVLFRLNRRRLSFVEVGLGHRKICLRITQVRLGLQDGSLKQRRFDLRDHLVFLHVGVEIGKKLLDGSRDLRSNFARW